MHVRHYRDTARTRQQTLSQLMAFLAQPLGPNEKARSGRRFRGIVDQLLADARSQDALVEATWIGEGSRGEWTGQADDPPLVRLDVYYPERLREPNNPDWTACTCIDARTSTRALAALCLAIARAVRVIRTAGGDRRRFLASVTSLRAEDIASLSVPPAAPAPLSSRRSRNRKGRQEEQAASGRAPAGKRAPSRRGR
jgi:hypothetical protein